MVAAVHGFCKYATSVRFMLCDGTTLVMTQKWG